LSNPIFLKTSPQFHGRYELYSRDAFAE